MVILAFLYPPPSPPHTHAHIQTHTGMGEFAQCLYHWHPDYCGKEQITVQAGSTIVFDIRLKFINSGPCGLPQNTGYLHFYKGEVTARNNVYSCSVRDDRCPETSKNSPIRAVWGGGHRFNLNLTKAYATVDDEALYTVSLHLHYRGESMEQIN